MANRLGKWSKYKVLAGSRSLTRCLPRTRRLNQKNLWMLLKRYKRVIVKPSSGSGGLGVIQVSSLGKGKYKIHAGRTKQTRIGRIATYRFLKRKASRRGGNIVQQKIPLARVHGRPFDIRVMVQRPKRSDWFITGKLAKIAGAGYIITNTARSRGRVVPVTTAVHKSNIRGKSIRRIQRGINRVAVRTVRRLHKHYHSIHTVGVDIGLDSRGKAWLIEANFRPSKSLFKKLKNKSMYKRIIYYYAKRKNK